MSFAPISSEGRRVMASPDHIGTRQHGAALSNLAERADHSGPDPQRDGGEEEHGHALAWPDALRIAGVALAATLVWFHLWLPPQIVTVIGVFGLLIGGWPIVKEAAKNALARRMTMELSMTIAIVAAAAISEFFTALIITLFVLGAEVLENLTVARGRRAIRDLLDFLPRLVTVRRAGAVREAAAEALRPGDLGRDRGRRLWHRRRDAVGNPRRCRSSSPAWRHHQGWPIPRDSWPGEHGRARQDGHAHSRPHRGTGRAPGCRQIGVRCHCKRG